MSNANQEPTANTDLSEAEARKLNDKIKRGLAVTWLQIAQAYRGRIHLALGYPTWNDYLTEEFGGVRPLWVAREHRPQVVHSLRATGMSLRAIASTMGVTERTVRRDLDESTAADAAVEPTTVTGLDGRDQPARRKPKPAHTQEQDAAAFRDKARRCHVMAIDLERLYAKASHGKELREGMASVRKAVSILQGVTDSVRVLEVG